MAQRRQHSGEFKAKVVVQALKGQHTLNEIASKYGVHPVQVAQWKKQALEELPHVFADHRLRRAAASAGNDRGAGGGREDPDAPRVARRSAVPSPARTPEWLPGVRRAADHKHAGGHWAD